MKKMKNRNGTQSIHRKKKKKKEKKEEEKINQLK